MIWECNKQKKNALKTLSAWIQYRNSFLLSKAYCFHVKKYNIYRLSRPRIECISMWLLFTGLYSGLSIMIMIVPIYSYHKKKRLSNCATGSKIMGSRLGNWKNIRICSCSARIKKLELYRFNMYICYCCRRLFTSIAYAKKEITITVDLYKWLEKQGVKTAFELTNR